MASSTSRPTSSSAHSPSTMPTSIGSGSEHDDNPTIQFTSVQEVFETINRLSGDFLTVTDVTPSRFAEIEKERVTRRRKFRFRRYHANSHILIITLPTELHESLHLELYQRYRDQLVRQDKQETWKSMGSTTFRARGHPGGDGGEGDSTGGPESERSGPDGWPTLVIEAGDSESLDGLRADMRWWFSTSEHNVKIVLLAKFDHRQHQILLECWEEEAAISRPGATTTRRAATLQPVLRQSISISRNQGTDPISYNVTRGALVLRFRLLYLRAPCPQEADFVIGVPDLQRYAEMVWSSVRA